MKQNKYQNFLYSIEKKIYSYLKLKSKTDVRIFVAAFPFISCVNSVPFLFVEGPKITFVSTMNTNNTETNVLVLFYWKLITMTLMKTLPLSFQEVNLILFFFFLSTESHKLSEGPVQLSVSLSSRVSVRSCFCVFMCRRYEKNNSCQD